MLVRLVVVNTNMWSCVLLIFLYQPVHGWKLQSNDVLDCTGSTIPNTNVDLLYIAQDISIGNCDLRILVPSDVATTYSFSNENATLQTYSDGTGGYVNVSGSWNIINYAMVYEVRTDDMNATSPYGSSTFIRTTLSVPVECNGWTELTRLYYGPDGELCSTFLDTNWAFGANNILTDNSNRTSPWDPFTGAPTHLLEVEWTKQQSTPTIVGWYERHSAFVSQQDTFKLFNTTLVYKDDYSNNTRMVWLDGATAMVAGMSENNMVPLFLRGEMTRTNPVFSEITTCTYMMNEDGNAVFDFTAPVQTTTTLPVSSPLFWPNQLRFPWASADALLSGTDVIKASKSFFFLGRTVNHTLIHRSTEGIGTSELPLCPYSAESCSVLWRTVLSLKYMDKYLLDASLVRLDLVDSTKNRYYAVTAADSKYDWSPINKSMSRKTTVVHPVATPDRPILYRIQLGCGNTIYEVDVNHRLWINNTLQRLGTERTRVINMNALGSLYVAIITSVVNGTGYYVQSLGSVYFGDQNGVLTNIPVLAYDLNATLPRYNLTAASVAVVLTNPSMGLRSLDVGDGVVLYICYPNTDVWGIEFYVSAGVWAKNSHVQLIESTDVLCSLGRLSDPTSIGLRQYVARVRANDLFTNTVFNIIACTNDDASDVSEMNLKTHYIVPSKSGTSTKINTIWNIDGMDNVVPLSFPNTWSVPKTWAVWVYTNVTDLPTIGYDPSITTGMIAMSVCMINTQLLLGIVPTDGSNIIWRDAGKCDDLVMHAQSPIVGIVYNKTTRMVNLAHGVCGGIYNLIPDPTIIPVMDGEHPYFETSINGAQTSVTDWTYPQSEIDNGVNVSCTFLRGGDYYSYFGTIGDNITMLVPAYTPHEPLISARDIGNNTHYLYRDFGGGLVGSPQTNVTVSSRLNYIYRLSSVIPLLGSVGDFYGVLNSCRPDGVWPLLYPVTSDTNPFSERGSYTSGSDVVSLSTCLTVDTEVTVAATTTTDQTCTSIKASDVANKGFWLALTSRDVGVGDRSWNAFNATMNKVILDTPFVNTSSSEWYDIKGSAINAFIDIIDGVPSIHSGIVAMPSIVDVAAPRSAYELRRTWRSKPGFTSMPRAYLVNNVCNYKSMYENGIVTSNITFDNACPLDETHSSNMTLPEIETLTNVLKKQTKGTTRQITLPIGIYGQTSVSLSVLGYETGSARTCHFGTHHINPTNGNCTVNRICDVGFEYQTVAPSHLRNRTCVSKTICGYQSYESSPGTATTDRTCTLLDVCLSTEYVAVGPTATTNRACLPRTINCSHGYYYVPQVDAYEPGSLYLAPACVRCAYGTTTFINGTGTSETIHNLTGCTPALGLHIEPQPNNYVSYVDFIQSNGSIPPIYFSKPCRVCYGTQIEVVGCQNYTNRVCGFGTAPPTVAPTLPPTPCSKHQYYNQFRGIDRCVDCTKCVEGAYIRTCTSAKDAECGEFHTYETLRIALLTLYSVYSLWSMFFRSPKQITLLWIRVRNAIQSIVVKTAKQQEKTLKRVLDYPGNKIYDAKHNEENVHHAFNDPAATMADIGDYPARHHVLERIRAFAIRVYNWPGEQLWLLLQRKGTYHRPDGGDTYQL